MTRFQSDIRRLAKPLTEGLRVRHIAHFGLITCSANDDPKTVLARAELDGFDQIPIVDSFRIVRVLEKGGNQRPLDEDILVSADEPLATFIHTVRNHPYRLVVDGTRINGIVTSSDLLKGPVLTLGYSLLAQLELLANRAIDLKYKGSDEWLLELEKLDKKQSKKIQHRKNKAKNENLSLPAIELADLIDKLKVIPDFLPKGCEFEAELKDVVKFRNIVDHVRLLVPSIADLDQFVHRFEIVIHWIVAIEEKIAHYAKAKEYHF